MPAAFSGITAAFILAVSRAIGETMIVAIAAGQQPRLTGNPFVPIETMTAYIVQVSLGDTPQGTHRVPHHLRGRHAALRHDVRPEPGQHLAARALPRGIRMRKQADLLFQIVSLATLIIALAALGALVYDIVVDGASRLSWSFLTNIASRNADEAGVYHALMGSIWVIALTGAAGAADRRRGGDLSRRVRHAQPDRALHRAQHRQPRRGAVDHLRPARPRAVRAPDGHGPERAGRRGDARAAGAAGRDPVDARSAAHGAELDSRRLLRARRHQVADDLEPGAADGAAGRADRPDPRAVARDRRDRAAHHDRRAHLHSVSRPTASGRSSPCCRSRSSTGCRGRRRTSRPTPPPASSCCWRYY